MSRGATTIPVATKAGRRGRGASDSWNLGNSTPLGPEALRECILRYQIDGDAAAGARVIESHLRLVAKMARGYSSGMVLTDDLMAEGALALRRALDTFELDRGPSFTSYASVAIGHALRAAARLERQPVRIPSGESRKAAARHRAEARFFAREGRWPTLAEVESDRAEARAMAELSGEVGDARETGDGRLLEPTVAQRAWVSLDGGADERSLQASQIPDGAPTPADVAGQRDELGRISGALATLPEPMAAAIKLRFGVEEESPLSVPDVARRLGVPVVVAERAIMDGLRRLRATMSVGAREQRLAG